MDISSFSYKAPWAANSPRILSFTLSLRPCLIAAVTEREPVQRIRRHPGEPPPPVSPARSPPRWDTVDWNQTPADAPENGEPAPEFEFDQTVSW